MFVFSSNESEMMEDEKKKIGSRSERLLEPIVLCGILIRFFRVSRIYLKEFLYVYLSMFNLLCEVPSLMLYLTILDLCVSRLTLPLTSVLCSLSKHFTLPSSSLVSVFLDSLVSVETSLPLRKEISV